MFVERVERARDKVGKFGGVAGQGGVACFALNC